MIPCIKEIRDYQQETSKKRQIPNLLNLALEDRVSLFYF